MEQCTEAHSCLYCENQGCLTLSMPEGKVVFLCPTHWNVWYRRLQQNDEPTNDKQEA